MHAPCRQRASAFTLVELLVVIAIIGILVALLLPAVQAAREAARRSECLNNLKQHGLAIQTHHDTRKAYPAGRTLSTPFGVSWAFQVLPYMEENAIHDALDAAKRVDDQENATAMRTPVETFFCPSQRPAAADRDFDNDDDAPLETGVAAAGDYVANPGHNLREGMDPETRARLLRSDTSRVGPMFTYSEINQRRVTDGTSSTYAVVEKHVPPVPEDPPGPQGAHYHMGDTAFFAGDMPNSILRGSENGIAVSDDDPSREKAGSEHPGVVHAVFLDGHVQPIRKETDVEVLMTISAIGDGEVIDESKL